MCAKAAALVSLLALAALAAPVRAADYIWWEGEDAVEHNFNNRDFAPGTLDHPEGLSNGNWLNTGGDRQGPEVFARWRVEVPQAGAYYFYARKFWHHGPFRWRFDGGDWHEVRQVALLDNVDLKKFICANWVSLGTVTLEAGAREFEVRLLAGPGEGTAAAFDCFVLTRTPFAPAGKLRPGEKTGKAMPGWWAFEPDADAFAESPIDLRHLNHQEAGEFGFLKADGLDFVFEKEGRPVRFWAVCAAGEWPRMDHASVDYLARRLAKAGVNMVRVHGAVFDANAADPATVDTRRLDDLHYFVAALKKEGIYTSLSFYFPLWFGVKPEYGLPGYEKTDNKVPFALLFFYPRMQEIWRSWARGLVTTVNPYTGLSFADDPAVALFEIINEDNYFFWTFTPGENIPAECMAVLEGKFGAWAARKYGSLDAAGRAWGHGVKGDDFANGRAGLMGVWNLTRDGLQKVPDARLRAMDQARFLTEDLRAFYEQTMAWLRRDLGVKCPVIATNWTVADPVLLGALDKYTNDACEVMDRHAYFGGPHQTDRGWTVTADDRYQDLCGLLHPEAVPVREIQYAGHPCIASEYSFTMPNRYRTESVFLAAVYGALQGTDGYVFFAGDSLSWAGQLGKWPVLVPSVAGQFPAAALLYRRGDVAEADTVVRQVLRLEDLYALKGSGAEEPQNVDNLRAAEIPAGGRATGVEVSNIDPLAFYVGRVLRTFSQDTSQALLTDLTPFIDRQRKLIRSLNGQAAWDYGLGLATVNTPRSQGATGMLSKAGRIELADVTIESGNDYGSVIVTSLTGEPIASAARVLVQVMSEDTNFGWQDVPEGQMKRIASLGGPPLNVRDLAGRVTIRRPDAASLKVVPLDPNGYPVVKAVAQTQAGGGLSITLAPDVLYYVVEATR